MEAFDAVGHRAAVSIMGLDGSWQVPQITASLVTVQPASLYNRRGPPPVCLPAALYIGPGCCCGQDLPTKIG